MCEARFSSYTSTKKQCKRLDTEADIRIQLSSVKPDLEEICKNVNAMLLHFALENVIFIKIHLF